MKIGNCPIPKNTLEKMKRGNYKQYSSIDKMPKSTRYDLAKKLKVQESEELKKIYNQNLDSFIQQKNLQQQEQENMIEPTETIVNNQELINVFVIKISIIQLMMHLVK